MTENNTVVAIRSVSKTLRQRLVLDKINLEVTSGELVGIYGPNGSGKSMLLRVISGLVLPDSGEVYVFGKRLGNDMEFSPDLGALIDGPGFLLDRSGLYNLQLLASICNVITPQRIVEVLRQVGLDPGDNRPVRTYSTGMRQRLGVAQAIMENPRLLLLDEPTSALDPEGVADIYGLLQELNGEGCTIILISHNQIEIQHLCRRIYRMQAGLLLPDA